MKQNKKEWSKKNIVQAAKRIIKTSGYESLTVRHLAEITGYSYTNVYYYFKDLDALFWELRLDMIEDMITELTSTPSHKIDPFEEILDVFITYINYYFQNPNIFRFFYFYSFIQPVGDDSSQKLEGEFDKMWQTSFYRLIQEKIIQPNDIEVITKTIIYALHGMIMLSFSSNGSIKRDDVEKELVKTVTYVLKKS
ncbi:MAG: TetR/AcrR family transcriptional regulator [Tenericutes bacterium]|jgi:AcrR family transcriptional regulator|nr:TetR/AcrR family transcriptional regulator [Mycoplasmatota bacterium]